MTWGEFDRATQAHGLATTGGAMSTTGIAGLTLGGGLGWLMRNARHDLRQPALGRRRHRRRRLLRASADEHPDLFWGVRGGGGNFGVVTAFEFRLHPVGPLLAGMVVHPLERGREVLRFYRDFTQDRPGRGDVFAGLMTSPEGAADHRPGACYNGPPEEGEAALRPAARVRPAARRPGGADDLRRPPVDAGRGLPAGAPGLLEVRLPDSLSDEAIDTIVDRFATVTSPLTAVMIEQFGGAVRRVRRDETAFVHRDADYNLAIIARWTDPAEADAHIAWTRGLSAAMQPYAAGVYVNYLGVERGQTGSGMPTAPRSTSAWSR